MTTVSLLAGTPPAPPPPVQLDVLSQTATGCGCPTSAFNVNRPETVSEDDEVVSGHLLHIAATRAAHQLWVLTTTNPSPLLPQDLRDRWY